MDNISEHALKPGTRIRSFEIRSVVGAGGFGITYKAWDHQLECDVALKEYLPDSLATRAPDEVTITILSQEDNNTYSYETGLKRFQDEARTLAKFRHPNVVGVKQFLSANGTAYMVMDYEEGQSLAHYVKDHPSKLPEDELKRILGGLLEGITTLHAHDILHRDISPKNINMRESGDPVLLDFGSARQAAPERTARELTSMVTFGYAPFEQYSPHGNQGPWTDLYALGATLYYCITGKKPVDGMDRYLATQEGWPDPLPALEVHGRDRYSVKFLRVIDWMLRIPIEDRPQKPQQVLEVLEEKADIPAPRAADDDKTTIYYRENGGTSDDETGTRPLSAGEIVPAKPSRGVATRAKTILAKLLQTGLVLLAVLGIIYAPVWLAKRVESAVPRLLAEAGHSALKVEVSVEAVSASPLGEYLELKGLRISNPRGYQSAYLMKVGSVTLQGSSRLWWLSNTVQFSNVQVSSPKIIYERAAGKKYSNLEAFAAGLEGGDAAQNDRGGDKRLVINDMTIAAGILQAVGPPNSDEVIVKPLNEVVFTDIGKNANLDLGATLALITVNLVTHVQETVKESAFIRRATDQAPEKKRQQPRKKRRRTTAPARPRPKPDTSEALKKKLRNWLATPPGKDFPDEESETP